MKPAAAPVVAPVVSPAVADILDAADAPVPLSTPVTPLRRPAGRPPLPPAKLSMNPEAIRARRRRADAQRLHAQPAAPILPAGGGWPASVHDNPEKTGEPATPAGPRFTQDAIPPAAPLVVSSGPSPDQLDKAIRNWSMILRGAGYVASVVFRSDGMKVPEKEAREGAAAILDGWPELALDSDQDYKKLFAVAYIGSLAFERYGIYQRGRSAPPSLAPVPSPAQAAPRPAGENPLPMMPGRM